MTLADLFNESQQPEAEEKPEFDPTGGNQEFYSDLEDRDSILDNIEDMILSALKTAGKQYGYAPTVMEQFFWGHWTADGALGFIDERLQWAENKRDKIGGLLPADDLAGVKDEITMGAGYYFADPNGFLDLVNEVWRYYDQKAPFDLMAVGAPTSGGGSGGSRGLSEQDIRNRYDIDSLAGNATELWRQWLLEEPDDPRGLAEGYVNAIVATGAQKQIDFRTFVESHAKKTARWASIYRNKPESMAPEAFLGQYFTSARQVTRPGNAADVAIGGAQLGASPEAFANRLRRTEEHQSSAAFINELGNRTKAVSGILRG